MQSQSNKLRKYNWKIVNLGVLEYGQALELQQQYYDRVKNGDQHYILFLQHEPVITLGRRTDPSHIIDTEEELREKGISLYHSNRGGSATYHGPGQLIGYIICKSSRFGGIHSVVSKVLQAIKLSINQVGIKAQINPDNPGVWTDTEPQRKLSAVGMSNKDGHTMHGFAVNVDMPLTGFSTIVPCGLSLPVSTLAIETGKRMKVTEFIPVIQKYLLEQLK